MSAWFKAPKLVVIKTPTEDNKRREGQFSLELQDVAKAALQEKSKAELEAREAADGSPKKLPNVSISEKLLSDANPPAATEKAK